MPLQGTEAKSGSDILNLSYSLWVRQNEVKFMEWFSIINVIESVNSKNT